MIGQHDHVLWIVLTSMMKIVNDVRLEDIVQVEEKTTSSWLLYGGACASNSSLVCASRMNVSHAGVALDQVDNPKIHGDFHHGSK